MTDRHKEDFPHTQQGPVRHEENRGPTHGSEPREDKGSEQRERVDQKGKDKDRQ